MTRFVIGPDVALHLAQLQAVLPAKHQLLAPTLIRSQVLAELYARVQRDELDRKTAERQLDHLRALRLRLLGDRVLQGRAWEIAAQLGWPDTDQRDSPVRASRSPRSASPVPGLPRRAATQRMGRAPPRGAHVG